MITIEEYQNMDDESLTRYGVALMGIIILVAFRVPLWIVVLLVAVCWLVLGLDDDDNQV